MESEIRKLVANNLSIRGLTFGIMPILLALWMTPSTPVKVRCNLFANLRAFKSSNKSNTSSYSMANAIALASPLSI